MQKLNTPIPEKNGSCMQARLNSPLALKRADEMPRKKEKNSNVCRLELHFSEANVVEKWNRVGQKCCAAVNSNNQSKNRPDLSYRIIHSGVSIGEAR